MILAALLLLTACSPAVPAEPATAPTESAPPEIVETIPDLTAGEVNPAIGETVPLIDPLSAWVYPAVDEQIVWDDVFENHYDVTIRVPQVSGEWAAEFNEQVRAAGEAILTETRQCAEEGYSPATIALYYQASLHDDLLSILVVESFDSDYTVYDAYVFDVGAGEQRTTAELCREFLDTSYPQFLMAVNAMVRAEFEDTFGQYGPVNEPEFYAEILESIENDTIAMLRRGLYLDEDGQLMLVYWAPSMAGASYYPRVMPLAADTLTFPGEEEAYRWLFDLCDREEGVYTEADRELLYLTREADPELFDSETEQ